MRITILIFSFCLVLLFPVRILGQGTFYTVESVPNPKSTGTGYVSNPDKIISEPEVQELNRLIAEMEDSTTAQVAVVILQSIGNTNPKQFTTKLFNTWGIGQAGVDNGLLIFAVMDQRRTEFETGYGLEGVLPDVVCYRIAMQQLVPEFKQGRYGDGLIAAVKQVKVYLEDPAAAEEISANPQVVSNPYRRTGGNPLFKILGIYGGISLLVCLLMLGYVISILQSKQELHDKYHNIRHVHWIGLIFLFPLPYIFLYLYLKSTLKRLRYQERFSRKTGEPMYLLSEEEEDAYLQKGQITEEEIGSVDYDVWITDAGDDMLILRYKKRLTKYKKCPQCAYLTYYHAYSRTLVAATYSSSGTRLEVRKCKSCNYQTERRVTIPQKVQSSSSSGGSFSSGGGGSWGGGSSGGGGAGASW